MLKHICFLFILLILASTSQAKDRCPSNTDAIIAEIEKQSSCPQATATVRNCLQGSFDDIPVIGAAKEICLKDYKTWPEKVQDVHPQLMIICISKYENEVGEEARTELALCQMNAIELLSSIGQPY